MHQASSGHQHLHLKLRRSCSSLYTHTSPHLHAPAAHATPLMPAHKSALAKSCPCFYNCLMQYGICKFGKFCRWAHSPTNKVTSVAAASKALKALNEVGGCASAPSAGTGTMAWASVLLHRAAWGGSVSASSQMLGNTVCIYDEAAVDCVCDNDQMLPPCSADLCPWHHADAHSRPSSCQAHQDLVDSWT